MAERAYAEDCILAAPPFHHALPRHQSMKTGAKLTAGLTTATWVYLCQDGNLRQCAVYGLGVAAQHQPAAFRQVAPSALAALMAVIQKPGAREEDNAMATENAIGALGKVLGDPCTLAMLPPRPSLQ